MKKPKYCHNGSHFTQNDREKIQTGIEERLTKREIAISIHKDETTVAKEIRKHRIKRPRNPYYYPNICVHRKKCRGCKKRCENYIEETCLKRDRSPGACNKCPKYINCHLDKYYYDARKAQMEYEKDLVDFREGINLTTKERDELAKIIVPLINKGQSIYQILSAHPEISQCEKTIYNYIDMGVFASYGLHNLSLKEKTKRKQFNNKYKKRKEKANFTNRTYKDYCVFIEENPNIPVVEMDTIYNDVSGPYIQTLMFTKASLMIGFLHEEKTSESMAKSFDQIEEKLGCDVIRKLIPVVLTDRGSEFIKYDLFEYSKNNDKRLNIFYCDPMQSSQKPHVENNHNFVRDIIPKHGSLDFLNQDLVDLMFSHINSTPREKLNGKTPYELFEFYYGKEILDLLNIRRIKRDEVTLKPYLLKQKN